MTVQSQPHTDDAVPATALLARTGRTPAERRSDAAHAPPSNRRLQVDFVIITVTGNLTRFLTVSSLIARDASVEARWYPIRTWLQDDWLRILPGAARVRARHFLDSLKAFRRGMPDATVIHAFETYHLYALYLLARRSRTVYIINPDGGLPGLPASSGPSRLRRLALDRTDLFVPWSQYAAEEMTKQFPDLPRARLRVLHPGINLPAWPFRGIKQAGDPFKLLFVAGDLERKGVATILKALESGLLDGCEVDIATQTAYLDLNPALRQRLASHAAVRLHLDLAPGSAAMRRLYDSADVLIHPTTSDTSSWVALEAMATGVPVVIRPLGGIPDIVIDGETGLCMHEDSARALAAAVHRLRTEESLRTRLTLKARGHVEENFDAERNTRTLLDWIREFVAARRSA
jgi:glycosyltransferase involved in cell wall biosynthesis